MKYLKLFENFVFEYYNKNRSVPFSIPDFYELPDGLSNDKFYAVKIVKEGDNIFYGLLNYSQLKSLYDAINMELIARKISWYAEALMEGPKEASSEYARMMLKGTYWCVDILSETVGDIFPYYVYASGENDPSSINNKIEDLSKKCKACGDEPSTIDLLPGNKDSNNKKKCGEGNLVFDPGMGMKLSDIVIDDSGTHDSPEHNDFIYQKIGFYIRFDSLGVYLGEQHPSYQELNRFTEWSNGGNYIYDISVLLDLITYKPDLVNARKMLTNKEGARDFMDDVFAYLVDNYVPNKMIKSISDILNPEDLKIDSIKYHMVPVDSYRPGWSEEEKKYSEYPNYKTSGIYLALPGDEKITKKIIEKLPKSHKEISEGLDSVNRSELESIYIKGYKRNFSTLDKFIDLNLKRNIYLVEPSGISKKDINLYDGKLPSINVLKDETNCQILYGITSDITMDYINRLSPIQLYLDIFFKNNQ